MKVRNKKKRLKDTNLLLKIALHYAATNDDSWYKRCLSMLFNTEKGLLHFVYKKFKYVDANKGFLYDQALKSASWFKRHSRFPWKCDKSTSDALICKFLPQHVPMYYCVGPVKCLSIDMLCNWASVYRCSDT